MEHEINKDISKYRTTIKGYTPRGIVCTFLIVSISVRLFNDNSPAHTHSCLLRSDSSFLFRRGAIILAANRKDNQTNAYICNESQKIKGGKCRYV